MALLWMSNKFEPNFNVYSSWNNIFIYFIYEANTKKFAILSIELARKNQFQYQLEELQILHK